jgi:hypothetical protein
MTTENPITPPTWTEPTTPVTPPVPAAAPVGVAAARIRRSGAWLNVLLGIAALVAVGGVAFAVGRSSAPAATPPFAGLGESGVVVLPDGSFDPGAFPGGNDGAGGPNGIGSFGGPTIDGTVTAIDADALTITLANGQEMTVALDDATTYHAATDASASDIAVGDEVSVGVDGFGRGPGAGNGDDAAAAPTARDVTVSR